MTTEQKIAEAERLLRFLGFTRTESGHWELGLRLLWLDDSTVDDLLPDLQEEILHLAAPELLAALERIASTPDIPNENPTYGRWGTGSEAALYRIGLIARAAIAAAKGETNE